MEHPNFCSTSTRKVVIEEVPQPSAGLGAIPRERMRLGESLFRPEEEAGQSGSALAVKLGFGRLCRRIRHGMKAFDRKFPIMGYHSK